METTNPKPPARPTKSASVSGNVLVALKDAVRIARKQWPELAAGTVGTINPGLLPLAQRFFSGLRDNFGGQMLAVIEELCEKGQIKEDYLCSDAAQACFADLLDYIDRISPDPKRYEAIREAFLKVLARGETGKHAPHAQQLLRVIYELSAGEIVVLAAIYNMGSGMQISARVWQAQVANASGLLRDEIVAGIEAVLMAKRLILPRSGDVDMIREWGTRNRLTQLGVEVCEHIQRPE